VSAVFVSGTGTDIGKTFVTAALIHELRRRGRAVDALKPVVSGFDPAQLAASDPGVFLAALGRAPTAAALDRIAPWRYSAPLSPDMAARREG
jgi:dethiobiotin synthetase